MDDTTFHQELARLKHRISQMASTYQRSPLPSQPLGRSDTFHNQLYDLKAQLESMQNSLSSLTGTPTQPHASRAWHHLQTLTPSPAVAAPLEPHSQLSLPSGPLFWQLFTSLRTDVRSLDSRVAGLEQNLSNLEDRVDNLEPTQFTPAASEDTQFNTSAFSYAQPAAQQFGSAFDFGSPSALDYGFGSPVFNEWATETTGMAPLDFAVDDFGMLPSAPNFSLDNQGIASEGVAFRDREIAHLDELMRKAQESIHQSDTVILEKDAQIRQLVSERDYAEDRIGDLQQSVQVFGMKVNEKKDYIEYLEEESQSKDAALRAWASKHNAMQQSFLEKKTQLCHADRQIQQLQRALYDLQSSRNDEIDELASNKDEEIMKLREFFEAKEAVVYQQEQIIARGATLLEDRDAELARLSHQIKGLDDDYRNETRERARFARLLDERDDEIGQLKASLSHALMPTSGSSKPQSDEASAAGHTDEAPKTPYPLSPFATAGTARRPASHGGQWTPKAIDNYAQLPHEQRRASVWKTGLSNGEQHKFGVPGGLASSPSRANTATNDQSRDLRRSDSVKLLRRLALVEEGGSRQSPADLGSSNVRRRSRLPLDDDVASRPPLPARVPPRKMASVNELGRQSQRDREANHQRPMARHQSIQELSGHRLQAYVEDGASGGDA